MPILRVGPWGNSTDPHQSEPSGANLVPSDDLPNIDYFPVNVGKTNWPGKVWSSYYYVNTNVCPGPETVTAESTLNGDQQLTKGTDCIYTWVSPYGEFYGKLEILWRGDLGYWEYNQYYSLVRFDQSNDGPTTSDDPTGTYTSYQGTFTVITP